MPVKRASCYTADVFLRLDLKPRDPILVHRDTKKAVIRSKDSILLHAQRGVGKSTFAMGLAVAIATKTDFLCWRVPRARRVMIVDGEMPAEDLQENLRKYLAINPSVARSSLLRNLAILPSDMDGQHLPKLDTPEGQSAISNLLKRNWRDDEHHLAPKEDLRPLEEYGIDVLIIDNAACLFRRSAEELPSEWEPAEEWLLSLRKKGITVILLAHDGRQAGHARGSSAREDFCNTTIGLRLPRGYKKKHGCWFEMSFGKGRALYGDGIDALDVQYGAQAPRGVEGWSYKVVGERSKKGGASMDDLEEDDSSDDERLILKYIKNNSGVTRWKLAACIQMGKKKVYELVEKLVEEGQISEENGELSRPL